MFAHFRNTVIEVAQLLGCQVECTDSPQRASELLKQGDCRMLIADAELMDQIDLKQCDPDRKIAIVAISDIDEETMRKRAGKQGCSQLLARHYSNQEIAFVLNNLLHNPHDSRRKYPRVIASLAGSVETGGTVVEGTILNISEGGAFLKCFPDLKEGKEILFHLELPNGDGYVKLACRGRVVYVKPYYVERSLMVPGMGIEFTELENEQLRELLSRYVRDRLMQ